MKRIKNVEIHSAGFDSLGIRYSVSWQETNTILLFDIVLDKEKKFFDYNKARDFYRKKSLAQLNGRKL